MRTPDPKAALVADVYCGDVLAGHIRRTRAGSEFAYDEEFPRRNPPACKGIAFHLPFSQRVFPISGGGVHPFFAGLLPEGLRLTALAQRLKTSLDDHLSLLLAAGSDPIGDVCVTGAGEQPWRSRASIDVRSPDESDFAEAFRQTISEVAADPPPPVIPGVQDKVSG